MKLVKAEIKDFRLLKDLVLDFSTNPKKPLTVIRAANESGKTTTETALLWGLYGSNALPGRGSDYPLHPSDSLSKDKKRIEVSVEIEFETTEVVNPGKPSERNETHRYRLIRKCLERIDDFGRFERSGENATLFEVTPRGVEQIEHDRVQTVIEHSMPVALKDVYFTDGDRAMSFIEQAATQGVKRQRVRDAVEALLGLETLEKTIKHLNSIANKFSKQIDSTDYAAELERLNDQIESLDEDLEQWKNSHRHEEETLREGQKRLIEVEKKIEELLKLGDKEKLVRNLDECRKSIDRNTGAAERALVQVSGILRSRDLSASVIGDVATKGFDILNTLSQKKQLPKVNIPILEELLERDKCFCGESLRVEDDASHVRRDHIRSSIEESREADAQSEAASSLFYSVRSEVFGKTAANAWLCKYNEAYRDYAERSDDIRRYEAEYEEIQKEINTIDDTNLDVYRDTRDAIKKKIDASRMNIGALTAQIRDAEDRRVDRAADRERVEKKLHKTGVSTSKLDSARLCATVFERVFERMRNEEVRNVSMEMNRIFKAMIGSRPEENDLTLITKAELTEEFDIKVFGPKGHELNPDTDLNGASRRAITLAFILALTKVSKVEAPNVIDTPLGMMSGYVKQSVLLRLLEEGSQVVLFLTHDEIKGVEEILDKKAGVVFTLTNPAHYPTMLVHIPPVADARVLRCECDHRRSCVICERKEGIVAGMLS